MKLPGGYAALAAWFFATQLPLDVPSAIHLSICEAP